MNDLHSVLLGLGLSAEAAAACTAAADQAPSLSEEQRGRIRILMRPSTMRTAAER